MQKIVVANVKVSWDEFSTSLFRFCPERMHGENHRNIIYIECLLEFVHILAAKTVAL